VCADGLLFTISHVGVLMCRSADTGEVHWNHRLAARCLASPVIGDGKLYVVDQEGTLTVFAADVSATKLLAEYRLDASCAATPALADSAIFVRTARRLACLE
jgi:outer membrane protein assembly factor BamB